MILEGADAFAERAVRACVEQLELDAGRACGERLGQGLEPRALERRRGSRPDAERARAAARRAHDPEHARDPVKGREVDRGVREPGPSEETPVELHEARLRAPVE